MKPGPATSAARRRTRTAWSRPSFWNAAGARLVRLLEPHDAKRAGEIRPSAVRAFAFAESDFAKAKATHEAYWDLGGRPRLEEYSVDIWAPNLPVWGYLAARK